MDDEDSTLADVVATLRYGNSFANEAAPPPQHGYPLRYVTDGLYLVNSLLSV